MLGFYLLFDVRTINELNKTLRPLPDLLQKLPYFHISQAKLLSLLLTSENIIYAASRATHWHELYVEEWRFLQWLESLYLKILPATVSLKLLRTVVGVDGSDYFGLQNTRHQRQSEKISAWTRSDWVVQICNDFIVLNRIAQIYGLSSARLHEMLSERGVEPAYIFEGEEVSYLYDNLPSYSKLIDSCVKKLLN